MEPLLSICIPAYNNAAYIKDTIDSILSQTYKNLELVIVDDKSKDDTVAVIKSIPDERIRLYENEKNLGMSGNWNHCLELCKGEYIKLICADDMLAPDAIEKEARALTEHPDVVMAESDTRLVDLNGKYKGWYRRYRTKGVESGKKIARKGFFSQNYFGAPLANMFRKSVLDEVHGFDTNYYYILDYDLWVRIACLGNVYIIHEPLNFFRVRNDSNTGEVMAGDKTETYVKEHRYLVEKHAKELHMSKFEVELSVLIRRLRNFAGSVYLKLFVHD